MGLLIAIVLIVTAYFIGKAVQWTRDAKGIMGYYRPPVSTNGKHRK